MSKRTLRLAFPEQHTYPDTIYFKKESYRLIFVRGLDCYGETDSGEKTIKIKKGLSPRETFSTLIHELLHVIEFEAPVRIKHRTVYKLEKALFNLLVDNFL